MTRNEAYALIDGERAYQDMAWSRQGIQGDPNELTIGEFVLLLEQYVSQARAEWTLERRPEQNTMEVIRKIAGIAVNALEQHGAKPRRMEATP